MDILLLRPRHKSGRNITGRMPVHRVRGRKFGPVIHERQLRRTQDIAIYGAHASGKTRWLAKLYAGAAEVWPGKPAAMFRGLDTLAQWVEQPAAEAWHELQEDVKPWAKLRQHERVDRLVQWATAEKPVILIDDAHRLSTRKGDIAQRLVSAAGLVVTTASEETRVAMSLRMAIARRDPQVIRLSSDAAYDYTSVLTWMLCIIAAAMGAWPIAAALGGLKLASRGKRAARQT